MMWREKRWLLVTLGVLLTLNLAFFFTYRLRYQSRVESLDQRLLQSQDELTRARNERLLAEKRLAEYRAIEENIQAVHRDLWATPAERLGPLMIEIRELARRSGINGPKGVQYAQAPRKKGDDTVIMTVSFGVEGSYEQLRALLNLIELSKQFVIIDQITLAGGSSESNLRLQVQLRTLFHQPAPARGEQG